MLARQGRRLPGNGLLVLAAVLMTAWGSATAAAGPAASQGTSAGSVPSGAVVYLKQTDQALDRMDRMMSEATASYTRSDRAKSAEASLQEAREPAAGQFEIAGSNFAAYAALHETVKAAAESLSTLPPAGMVNKDLEGQMRRLLANAGWTSILRVVIVDKDWWVEAGTRRYLNVAAAAKAVDGSAYWNHLQISRHRLISGGWGPLELTHTGIRRSIPLANVNK